MAKAADKKPEPVEQEPVEVIDVVVAETVEVSAPPAPEPEPEPEPVVEVRDTSGDRVPDIQFPRSRK